MADQNTTTNNETNTPCPSTIDSPELQDKDIWTSYDNTFGRYAFHGGMEGYLENKAPSPESPQQECFYDDLGNLIDENHEYAGMRGTANEYNGHGSDSSELWNHFYNDNGGIWENGREAFATSVESYYDSVEDYVIDTYDSVEDYVADAFE